jgi:CubicO group peptidase (beta-lactamase class C family)
VKTPQEAGLDADVFDALAADLQSGAYKNVHAVLVEHDGALVFEQYLAGDDNRWGLPLGRVAFGPATKHDLRSISKSVTSLLVGIALGPKFEESLERPVIDYFPELREAVSKEIAAIKLRDVLTMSAGIEWNESRLPYTDSRNDGIRFLNQLDPIRYVLTRAVREPPGKSWNYNGGLTMVLGGVVQRITGKRLDEYAREVLFSPLGISEFEWLGNPGWRPAGMPSPDSGLRLRGRDLAKIGSLVLHEGKWKQQQIVPAEWVRVSTRRHIDIPVGAYDYGFQWWTQTLDGGSMVIAGIGRGGQMLLVVPDRKLVLTVFAGNYDDPSKPYAGERILQRIVAQP